MKPSVPSPWAVLLSMAACGWVQAEALDEQMCCDVSPCCKNVTTLNMTIQQLAEGSPYYEPIFARDSYTATYRSVCVTYFRIGNNLYLEFRTIVAKDGITEISVVLGTDLIGQPGAYRFSGLFAGCIDVNTKSDDVSGKSTLPDISPSCLNAFQSLVKNLGFNVRGFARPATGNAFSCVASYGNLKAVNYKNIPPSYRISYPQNSCS